MSRFLTSLLAASGLFILTSIGSAQQRNFNPIKGIGNTVVARGGSAGQAPKATNSGLLIRGILPSGTDRNIDRFSGNGYEHRMYINPAVASKGQLVVFLPGTGGKGTEAREFCSLAANLGYHVVSLAYPSSVSISEFRGSKDPDTFLKARENIIYGKVPFANLNVNEANSIHNRLIKLVQHQAFENPKEKWGQFLTEKGELDWEKLVLTGHSQGGGHAALLAMQHKVARVIMFGAPKDFNVHFNQPGKWFFGPNATPLDRYFGFVHRGDEQNGGSFAQLLANYRAMKLLPKYELINVDQVAAPYQHSRLLTSTRVVGFPHGAVIANAVYQDTWRYMLQEAVE